MRQRVRLWEEMRSEGAAGYFANLYGAQWSMCTIDSAFFVQFLLSFQFATVLHFPCRKYIPVVSSFSSNATWPSCTAWGGIWRRGWGCTGHAREPLAVGYTVVLLFAHLLRLALPHGCELVYMWSVIPARRRSSPDAAASKIQSSCMPWRNLSTSE